MQHVAEPYLYLEFMKVFKHGVYLGVALGSLIGFLLGIVVGRQIGRKR